MINIKYTAEKGMGSFIQLRDSDGAVVATFANEFYFKTITGAESVDEYNERPVRFKMTKREH